MRCKTFKSYAANFHINVMPWKTFMFLGGRLIVVIAQNCFSTAISKVADAGLVREVVRVSCIGVGWKIDRAAKVRPQFDFLAHILAQKIVFSDKLRFVNLDLLLAMAKRELIALTADWLNDESIERFTRLIAFVNSPMVNACVAIHRLLMASLKYCTNPLDVDRSFWIQKVRWCN